LEINFACEKMKIPETQHAVQLVGANQLILNTRRPVHKPGRFQILCKVEACGLCFSDLKLLRQFSAHPRKASIVSGIDPKALEEMPHYVPEEKPTVPGHEAVVRVVAVGENVVRYRPGERYLVQTDYRWLPTPQSNSAFGYNFEGGLQEYVLMDERVITAPDGESMLIPAPEELSASAIALCEPWACVEDAYSEAQRTGFKSDGKMLVVGEGPLPLGKAMRCKPDQLPEGQFSDIVYYGSEPDVVERLFGLLSPGGLIVIVQGNRQFGRPVTVPIGRIHYGGVRIVGTRETDFEEALRVIPRSTELRQGDVVHVIGAGGPMGTMHVIRAISQGVVRHIYASDLSEERLQLLNQVAGRLAAEKGIGFTAYNPSLTQVHTKFNYIVLMVPVPSLAAEAVNSADDGAIINVFAGIPADKTAAVDLDAYIRKRCYFVGTSGSTLQDMKVVLDKLRRGMLDTNLSVAAISGLDGAIDGIHAVEKNLIPGKIVVYPFAKGLGLTPLSKLSVELASVGSKLNGGLWNAEAERELKRIFAEP